MHPSRGWRDPRRAPVTEPNANLRCACALSTSLKQLNTMFYPAARGPRNALAFPASTSVSSSASHSVFLSFWHPKWGPKPLKTAILLKLKKHFHISSLFLLRIVLAPKSLPKHSRNHSKTHPKRIPKTHRESTPLFIDFASEMTPQMRSKNFKKSTPGALRGHMGPKEAQKGAPAPQGAIFLTFGTDILCFPCG